MLQKQPIFCNQGHNRDITFSTVQNKPAKQLMLSDNLRRVTVCRSTNIKTKWSFKNTELPFVKL